MRDEDVQALHSIRHATCANPVDLRHLAQRRPMREVLRMRLFIRGSELGIRCESLFKLAHDPRAFEGADGASEVRTGEIEHGWKRGAVIKPRRGLHDIWVTTRTTMRNLHVVPGWPAPAPRGRRSVHAGQTTRAPGSRASPRRVRPRRADRPIGRSCHGGRARRGWSHSMVAHADDPVSPRNAETPDCPRSERHRRVLLRCAATGCT